MNALKMKWGKFLPPLSLTNPFLGQEKTKKTYSNLNQKMVNLFQDKTADSCVKGYMKKTVLLFSLIFIVACKSNNNKYSAIQTKNSIMKEYLQAIDSLPFSGTPDLKLQLLKAYYNNDTDFLYKSYNDLILLVRHRKGLIANRFCEQLPPLNTLNYEEAYRFDYSAAFCDTSVTITIGKSSDSIVFDMYLYESHETYGTCKTISHITKGLNEKDWNSIIKELYYADFWGLIEDNGNIGFDGSTLLAAGYQRPINNFKEKYKSIYRWAAEQTAIGTVFKKTFDLSGIKVGCFHY